MLRSLLLPLVLLAPLAAAAEPGPIQERAVQLLENPAFQTEPPAGAPEGATRASKRRARDVAAGQWPSPQPLEPTPEPEPWLTVPAGGAAVAQAFLWVALGIAVLVGAMVLVSALDRHRRRAEPRLPVEPVALGVPRSGFLPLGELEALAAAGRFAEAIHRLLLRATARIAPRGSAWPESLTSREILARAQLGGEQRLAFQELVLAVERSLFGGRPLAASDWHRCRAAFDRLSAAEVGR